MKNALLFFLIFLSFTTVAQQPTIETSPITIVQRGDHHRIWQSVTTETDEEGKATYRTNSYTELETGMNVAYTSTSTPAPQAQFAFTVWSLLANKGYFLEGGTKSIVSPFGFKDCQFAGGQFSPGDISVALSNCLWVRVLLVLDDDKQDPDRFVYNNLFRYGSMNLSQGGVGTWIFMDNLFDQMTISQSATITSSNNAYVSGFSRLSPNAANDVMLTNVPIYLTSALARRCRGEYL